MSNEWSLDRLKKATLGARVASYKAIPTTEQEKAAAERYPKVFKFQAVSIGDKNGQAFFVPLDESSKKTAELIINAIAAYSEDEESE